MMKYFAYQASVVSQLTHELNTSLTGILGVTHFLKKTSLTPQQQTYLQTIQEATDRLYLLEKKLSHFN